ncbi:MAG: transcription-repair coupling factor [Zetaproteobacteria bacterium]|nr:transcription-repair coupling factor [Pseudobdellovibrionaceae bacterium]|tara:strand:- start:290 stop:3841 length:3552 start_codon:yes stop_codon:yes gene_type:complete
MESISTVQGNIFDIINKDQSAQIHAPTSSYKKIICTYILDALLSCGENKSRNLVVVFPNNRLVSEWLETFSIILSNKAYSNVFVLPVFHSSYWGAEQSSSQRDEELRRLKAQAFLCDGKKRIVVLTTPQALGQKVQEKKKFLESKLNLTCEKEYDFDQLEESFLELGFRSAEVIVEKGTFTKKGGIFDVFPASSDDPLRFEFLGDKLLSIRSYNLQSQRSLEGIKSYTFYPCGQVLLSESQCEKSIQKVHEHLIKKNIPVYDRNGVTSDLLQGQKCRGFDCLSPLLRNHSSPFFDYLSSSFFCFPYSKSSVIEAYRKSFTKFKELYLKDQENQKICVSPDKHFSSLAFWENFFCKYIEMGEPVSNNLLINVSVDVKGQENLKFSSLLKSKKINHFDIEQRLAAVDDFIRKGAKVIVFSSSIRDLENLSQFLESKSIRSKLLVASYSQVFKTVLSEKDNYFTFIGDLDEAIYDKTQNVLLLPSSFYVKTPKLVTSNREKINKFFNLSDLKINDFIIHVQHGVGQYKGLVHLPLPGVVGDFLKLQYKGGDHIYLPADKLNLLQKFQVSSSPKQPQTDRLGTTSWAKKKAKVSKSIEDIAGKLIANQAERKKSKGYTYPPPKKEFFELVNDFPYIETSDQLKCLDEIEADLRSDRNMDRLIIGDVGFGKTEVALRTAMRAVFEGFQVLVLVPTTVLCHQHFETFQNRLSQFGVSVEKLSRFNSPKSRESIFQNFSNGQLDVLIGTHILLSKKLEPKQLGLLVVDEEQRFGVLHKERLKELKNKSDILTMSATPIPRTLNMSLLGLKDVSVISTPPFGRKAIKTIISVLEDNVIKQAISYERTRGGQIYFVHNRVEDLPAIKAFLMGLFQDLKVGIAHGQMKENKVDEVLFNFMEGKFHLLLCTTIIEAGLDIPNVNTLIVNKAENFGLSQLHQLRGRVGRSTVQGFAYFLCSHFDGLSLEAKQRLEALKINSHLGSGFQIASYDMDIRGVGNILGKEQSGNIAAVGLEYYTKLLSQAIEKLSSGSPVKEKVNPEIKLDIAAKIEPEYITSEVERLNTYRSLFDSSSIGDLEKIQDSIIDRFGPLSSAMKILLLIAKIKCLLRKINASKIIERKENSVFEVEILFLNTKSLESLKSYINQHPQKYFMPIDKKVKFFLNIKTKEEKNILQKLNNIISFLHPLTYLFDD